MTRTFTVSRTEAGSNIVDWLRGRLHLSRPAVLALLQQRKVRVSGSPCSSPAWRLRPGQRVEVQVPAAAARPAQRPPPTPAGPAPSSAISTTSWSSWTSLPG